MRGRGERIRVNFSEKTGKSFTYSLTENSETKTVTKDISYRPVSIQIDADNPGATQTALIATTDNPSDNTYRNVMLELNVPLSYSFGSLVYKLTSITR